MPEALPTAEVDDRIRTATETRHQALIEAELTRPVLGAAPGVRTDTHAGLRNVHRPRTLTAPAEDLVLRIPGLRVG